MSEASRTENKLRIEKRKKENEMMNNAAAMGPELYEKTNGNKWDAIESIRDNENYSSDEKEYYMREVESYFVDKKRAENEIETEMYDTMYGKIRRKSGGYQTLRREIDSMSGIDERTRFGLFDLLDREYKVDRSGTGGSGGGAAGGTGKTDPATYHEIWDMIDNNTLLEKAPDWATFRSLFKDRLSITKLEEFGKTIYKNIDGGAAADPEIKMQQAGLFNKMMDDEKITDPQVRARVIDRYNYEVSAAERGSQKRAAILL